MTEEIFVDGLSKKHDTFVGKKELQQLFHENCAGQMSLFEFTTLLDVKSYFEKKQIHMVDQLQFLNALIEGYSSMRIRHYKELQILINEKCGSKEKISWEEVSMIINELDPMVRPEKLFENIGEGVLIRDFRKKVFELNIGGKGIGCFNLKSIKKIYDSNSIEEEEKQLLN